MKRANRVRARKSRLDSNVVYQTLIENLPQSIFVKDRAGRFVFANRHFCDEMGKPLKEMVGKTDFDFHPAELAEKYRADDQRVIESGKSVEIVEEHQVLGGATTYVQVVKAPIYDARGQVAGIQGIFWDVTARKQAENILRQSRDELERLVQKRTADLAQERTMLRTLIDHLPDFVYVKDAEGRYRVNNMAHARQLGFETPEGFFGKTVYEIFPHHLAEQFYADDLRVLQTGQAVIDREEAGVGRIPGTEVMNLTTKIPLRDDTGKVVGLVGITRDITQLKQAEEALANERNLLRTLIDNVPDAVYIKDLESRYLVSNHAHAAFLGVATPDQIVGKTVFDFFPPEFAARTRADDRQVMQSGQPLINREEQATVLNTGAKIWNLTTKVPLRDNTGKITGLLGISRDITERKRAEEMLRLQAARLQTAAEVARMVSSLLDIEQVLPRVADLIRERFGYYHVGISLIDETGEWIVLRASSSETLGHELEGVMKLRVRDEGMIGFVAGTGQPRVAQDVAADTAFVSHPHLPDTRAEAALSLKIGDTTIGALDIQSTQRDAFPPDAISILTTIADQIAVAIQNARLHAAEKQRAQELEQAYRALQDNQAKLLASEKMASLGRLTAGIAHEMNTPLAAVRAALAEIDKLVQEYQDSMNDPAVTPEDHGTIGKEMRHSIHLARQAAERAAGFVRSIKSQTRDSPLAERNWFNAVSIITGALGLLRYALRHAGCSVTFEPAAEDMQLFGAPGRLAQVVTNLVTNAIDASVAQGGGPITVNLAPYAEGLTLQVSDRGCGIAPEVLPKIFDPLFTTKPFGEGMGLGLTIVHDIVAGEFGGTIQVSTQVGQGSTFTVYFPTPKEVSNAA